MTSKFSYIVLRSGWSAFRKLYDDVHNEVKSALPYLVPGERYTTEQLCGPELWQRLSPVARRKAGGCLALLVANGRIGLVFAPSKQKWPRRYQLPPEQPRGDALPGTPPTDSAASTPFPSNTGAS
jgi:hypothetical protein